MASEVGSAYVTLIPSAKGFASKMQRELAGDVGKVGRQYGTEFSDEATRTVNARGKGIFTGLAKKAALAGVAAAGLAGVALGKWVKDAAALDSQQREVVTLFGETGKAADRSLGDVQKMTRKLSDEFGVAQETLTGGLYSAISAGVPRENALTFMRVASKAAIAGVTDTETAVDGLSSIINAFGLESKDASAVADSMFTAVKGGKTTFAELSDSIFNIAPAAAAAKVSFQEVNAGIAALTAGGTPTSVATTQMRAALTGLQKPSKELNAVFEKLGYENAQVAIESKGLGFALDAVKKASKGNNGELQKMLGSSEAVAAANVLAGTGAKKFSDELKAQATSAGATDKAYGVVAKSTTQQFKVFKENARNVGLAIGQALLPHLVKMMRSLNDNMPTIKAFVGEMRDRLVPAFQRAADVVGTVFGFLRDNQTTLKVVAGLIAALTVVTNLHALALGLSSGAIKAWVMQTRIVTTVTKAWAAVQWLLNAAMSANPLGLALVALAAVGVALAIAWRKSETFRTVVTGAFNSVKTAASKVFSWLSGAVTSAIDWVRKNWVKLVAILGGPLGLAFVLVKTHWADIKKATTTAWDAIKGVVTGALSAVVGFVRGLASSVAAPISAAWNGAKTLTSNLWDGIKTAVTTGISKVVGVVQDLKGKVTGALSGAGTWLTGIGRNIIEGLGAGIESMYQWVRDKVDALSGWIPGWVKKKLGIASPSKVMLQLGKWIGMGLAKGITGSSADVGAALGELNKQINARLDAAYDGKKLKKKTAELQDALKKRTAKLREHGKAWDELAAKLTGAQETLEKVSSYAGPIKDAVVAMGNLVGLGSREVTTGEGEDERTVTQITASTILEDLRAQAAEAAEFQSIMAGLRGSGLNQTTLDQLYQAGPEAALATAQALSAGGAAAIGEVNALTAQLSATALTVSDNAAESMYGIGVSAAQNIVNGFVADQATLEAQAATLVSKLVEAVKKASEEAGIDLELSVEKHKPKKKKGKKGAKLASGGRVTGATVALIGEGREPETVLPDSLLRGLLERTAANAAAGGGGISEVRVFIGERELTDLVRVEVNGAQVTQARQLAYGRRA